jgi:hypothetical protein
MYTFVIARASEQGYVDKSYSSVAKRGYAGLNKDFVGSKWDDKPHGRLRRN